MMYHVDILGLSIVIIMGTFTTFYLKGLLNTLDTTCTMFTCIELLEQETVSHSFTMLCRYNYYEPLSENNFVSIHL